MNFWTIKRATHKLEIEKQKFGGWQEKYKPFEHFSLKGIWPSYIIYNILTYNEFTQIIVSSNLFLSFDQLINKPHWQEVKKKNDHLQ